MTKKKKNVSFGKSQTLDLQRVRSTHNLLRHDN